MVGASSFIGSALSKSAFQGIAFESVNHRDISKLEHSSGFDVVLNCALDPKFKSVSYDEAYDADLAGARLAAKTGAHYVMLSTRRVYSSSAILRRIDENEKPKPDTIYGRNKAESEKRVIGLLGDQCTILRISNVFGYEPGRSGFFGMAVTSLRREQRVILDVSPFVVRDFIPIEALCEILLEVLKSRPSGIFNVGAGFGVPIGKVALWLIQGYGSGELVVTCPDERDAFIVNPDKLRSAISVYPSIQGLESTVIEIGRKARSA